MSVIAKNTLFSSITLGLRFLSNTLLFIIIARALGVAEFGRFTFAVSFAGIFLVLVDYGFNLLIIRDVAVSPKDALIKSSSILNAKIILASIATVLIFVTIMTLNYPKETEIIIYILWVAALFYSFALFFNAIFKGLNQFQYETYPTTIFNIVQFFLALLFIVLDYGTVSIAIAYLASRIIYFYISFSLVSRKIGRIPILLNIAAGLRVIKSALPFGIHTILTAIYFQLDTVFLSYLKGNIEVGYYQAGMRIVMGAMIICDILVSSYLPPIAEKIKRDPEGFKKIGTSLNKYLLIIGALFFVFLLLYSDLTVSILYGKSYAESVYILQLLSTVLFLRFAGAAYAIFITVADNQKLRAYAVGMSVVVNILLNIILIPRFGAIGAALSSIITHIILDVIYVVFALRLTNEGFIDINCIRGFTILSIIMSICYLLKDDMPALSGMLFVISTLPVFISSLNSEERRSIMNVLYRVVMRET